MPDYGLTVEDVPRGAPHPSAHRRRPVVEQLDLLAAIVDRVPVAERAGTAPFRGDPEPWVGELDLDTVETWVRHGLPADPTTRAYAVHLLIKAVGAYRELAASVDELLGGPDA